MTPAQGPAVSDLHIVLGLKPLDRLLCLPLFALEDHGYQQG